MDGNNLNNGNNVSFGSNVQNNASSPMAQPTPMMETTQVVSNTQVYQQPQMSGGSYNNNLQQPDSNKSNKKNLIIILIGVLVVIAIGVGLIFILGNDKNSDYKDYEDYEKEEEKIFETINKHFTYKDFKLADGILVEIYNDNKIIVDAEVKVEFYDEAGTMVDVDDDAAYDIASKGKSYVNIDLPEQNYSTYKVSVQLQDSFTETVYNDKIETISSNKSGDYYLFQVKNASDKKLDINVGVLFFVGDNILVGYDEEHLYDVQAGATTSGKVYVPEDKNWDPISFDRVEVVILSATAN